MRNLAYALVQVVHNFGAATVIGTAVASLWFVRDNIAIQGKLALVMAVAWAVQLLSGAAFGATSYYYAGHFPDIHGVAIAALGIKLVCASAGFLLAASYVKWGSVWPARGRFYTWCALTALAVTALSSAAFLRWFS